MIRFLTAYELPLCLEGGKAFFDEGQLPGGFKPDQFLRRWTDLVKSGVACVLGLFGDDGQINGALAFMLHPDIFNGDPVATESFWYMLPNHRGAGMQLLARFEQEARRLGCKRIHMIHLHRLQPEILGKLYARHGFEAIETNYVKVL